MEQMISKAVGRETHGGSAETAPVAMLTDLRVYDISGRELGVLAPVPADATPAEIIAQLIEQKAVEPAPAAQAYQMALREDTGFCQLDPAQTLEAASVPSGATLRLLSNAPGAALSAIHAERVQGDYEEMCRIRGSLLDWEGDGRIPPETYVVTYYLPSFIDAAFTERAQHRVEFRLPPAYPGVRPAVQMLDQPPVFHPNVLPNGQICIGRDGAWHPREGLGFVVLRVAKMLLYRPEVTGLGNPGNWDAARWYHAHRKDRFPLLPRLAFPDPLTGIQRPRRRIVIRVIGSGSST